MTKMSKSRIEPYDGKEPKRRKWTERAYPFAEMKIGDKLFETESLKYFRTAASIYFRDRPTKDYMTETIVRNGVKGVLLTRLR
jgi:hypothetical protein